MGGLILLLKRYLLEPDPKNPRFGWISRECTPEEYLILPKDFPILAQINKNSPIKSFGCLEVKEKFNNDGWKSTEWTIYGLYGLSQI